MKITLVLFVILYSTHTFGQKHGNQLIDSLRQQLIQKQEDSNKVKLLEKLSYAYATINPNDGVKIAYEALKLSEKIGWEKGIALANFDLSINYKSLSKYTTAHNFANRALDIYSKIKNTNGIAATMANIALIYLAQSNYPKALEYSFRTLKIYEDQNDKSSKTIVLENIGTIYQEQKEYDEAMKYYSQAIQINREQNNRTGIARNLGNIGTILTSKGSYDSALKYHNEALKVSTENADKHSIQINLANIANVFLYKHDYKRALEYQKTALAISEEIDDKSSIAINLGNVGETYFAMASDIPSADKKASSLSLAIQYLKQSISLCKEINYSGPQLEFTNYLKEAYSLAGDYKSALITFQEYSELKDSLFSNQNKLQIAALESQREVGIKTRDLKLKDKELYISKLELDREKRERIILLIGILFFVLVIGIVVNRLKKSRESNRQLELDKQLAESKIANREYRLKQAQAIAHFGNWTMENLYSGITIWSEELCRIFGIPVTEYLQTYDTWLSFIHPDDLVFVLQVIDQARKDFKETGFQHRIVRRDGTVRYVFSQAFYEFDNEGKPVSMYGVAHDITEVKLKEIEITKQNERYTLVNKASREAILDWDIVHDTTIFGDGFTDIFGYLPSETHNDLMSENLHPDDKDEVLLKLNKVLNDPDRDILETEFRFLKANRAVANVWYKGIFIRDENGKPLRAISVLMDITEMVERNRAIEKQNEALQEIAWIQSHVVRAPLTNLMSLVELLKHKEDYDLDEEDLLDKIQVEAANLDKVIRDVIKKTEE